VTPVAQIEAPAIDYLQLAPILATLGGSIVVLMMGLVRGRFVQRALMPALTLVSLLTAVAFAVAIWEPGEVEPIVEGALSMDTLALGLSVLFYSAGVFTVLLSLRSPGVRETGAGEYHSLLLASITGMTVLAAADNLVTVFVGFELLSIPLYVLCGSRVRQEASLESGLKYLVIGSVGSATLLYGLALIYGATGATDFPAIAAALEGSVGATDPLFLTGVALSATGLAFKASVAPFHQWTPDVYQGAPTPITSFMAVATKAAAFAIFLRLFHDALGPAQQDWAPALAALAWATIVIGNLGAIAQSSLKRMLAWSGVGQAGYMLVGVVVGTELGLRATAFYLAVYLLMNVAAFAVVIARERRSEHGDGIRSLEGLGAASPWLAWPMTIAMLALAGIPLTAGFFGKFYLIEAAVEGGWESLGVAIVIGSMLSLVYYLRVLAVMWMGPIEIELPAPVGRVARRVKPVGGWSPEADARAQPEVGAVAIVAAAATIVLGIVPGVLFDVAADVGPVFGALL
jgi:NADH-quinone oxidoreductase subunit N